MTKPFLRKAFMENSSSSELRSKIMLLTALILIAAMADAASIIQIRRDTATNWTDANTLLAQGELGIETDTLKLKIGNGTTAWNALAYYSTAAGGVYNAGANIILDSDTNKFRTNDANLSLTFYNQTDANGVFVKKLDLNTLGDQRWALIGAGGTSYSDANVNALLATRVPWADGNISSAATWNAKASLAQIYAATQNIYDGNYIKPYIPSTAAWDTNFALRGAFDSNTVLDSRYARLAAINTFTLTQAFTQDINANGNLVGDGATDITGMNIITADQNISTTSTTGAAGLSPDQNLMYVGKGSIIGCMKIVASGADTNVMFGFC